MAGVVSVLPSSKHLAKTAQEVDQVAIERNLCARSLRHFFVSAWQELNPGRSLSISWHIDAICDALEAVTRGDIRRIVINIPPRFTKSTLVCQVWQPWDWIRNPWHAFLYTSYAEELALRDAVTARRITMSDWYRDRWGERWGYRADQNTKHRYENNKGGYRFSTGVNGQLTGEGGDFIVVDDPHNVKEILSKTVMKETSRWFDESLMTRFNNLNTGRCVIIMQRLHELDLTAHVLSQGGWDHLCLPNEYDPKRHCVVPAIGFEDPRKPDIESKYLRRYPEMERGPGSMLAPERLSKAQVPERIKTLTPVGYASQYDQLPTPRGGAFFREEWFGSYVIRGDWYTLRSVTGVERVINKSELIFFITADTAGTEETYNDATALSAWAMTLHGDLLWCETEHLHVTAPEIRSRVRAMADRWNTRIIGIEMASTGVAIVQELRNDPTLIVRALRPVTEVEREAGVRVKLRDKVERAMQAQIKAEEGKVFVPASPKPTWWVVNALPELLSFTAEMTHAHDDIVDTFSYAVIAVMNWSSSVGVMPMGADPVPIPSRSNYDSTVTNRSIIEGLMYPDNGGAIDLSQPPNVGHHILPAGLPGTEANPKVTTAHINTKPKMSEW